MPRDIPEWEAVLNAEIKDITPLNDAVTHLSIGKNSHIYRCMLWENFYIWANRIGDRHLPFGESPGYRYATINYCLSGRCEVYLSHDTYIYMEPGMICISCNEPMDGYHYPTGEYTGLELAFDLDALRDHSPQALSDYGQFSTWIETLLQEGNGSHLAYVNEDCHKLITTCFQSLQQAEHTMEDHRFHTLTLLYHLMHGAMTPYSKAVYVTKGQRMIISEIEQRITQDLSKHIPVTTLARDYGISASSVKAYFEKVYGQPISHYLKEQRIEYAKHLLSETTWKVSEIAASCGYSHQGKFGEVFREATGSTPLEYRRLNYKAKEKNE